MSYPVEDLTDEQRRTISDAEAAVRRVVAEAHARLADSGMDIPRPPPPGEPGDFSCTFCACEFYLSGPGSGPGLACTRPGCGHSFTVHRVW